MAENYDIIIVGAGLVGMSMALALAKAGVKKIAIVEKTSISTQFEEKFDGRVSAVSLGSKNILDNIGAWEFMSNNAEPILDIRVTDGNTPFFLHYDHNEVGSEPFGYIVENRHIRYALYQALSQENNIKLIGGFSILSLENNNDNVSVTNHSGEIIKASLLIAADGRSSQIRELSGIKAISCNYRQTAIVCTIEHSLPHNGLAQERFFPAGPFAVLPMNGNKSSLVWVEPNERVNIYLELPEDEFIQEIQERVGDYLGSVKSAGNRFSYPLSLLHAKEYGKNRVVLIGDAAHGIHPIAGQGVNLGFRDVKTLTELIKYNYSLGLDLTYGKLTTKYEKLRSFDNVSMIAITDFLNRIFSNNIIPLAISRDIGLWAIGKLPAIKKIFMRHAMGLKNNHCK